MNLQPSTRILSVPGLARAAVPASAIVGTEIIAGTLGPATVHFEHRWEIVGLLVVPALGTPEELAALSIGILDEHDEPIVSDLNGNEVSPFLPFAAPCESLFGRGLRPFPLRRLVMPGDRWQLTLRNQSAAIVNIAAVGLYYRPVRS